MKKLEKAVVMEPVKKVYFATTVQLNFVKLSKILLSVKIAGGVPKVIPVHNDLQKYMDEKRISTLYSKIKAAMPFQVKVVEQGGSYSLSEDTVLNWSESAKYRVN